MAALVLLLMLAFVGSAEAHDWYSTLVDRYGGPCCGGGDCRPMLDGEVMIESDTIYMRAPDNGEWIEVWPDAIVARQSPDGRVHGCWWTQRRWGCVVLPGAFGRSRGSSSSANSSSSTSSMSSQTS